MAERLLYFCPLSIGGIADYAHAQATAIAQHSCEVVLLVANDWPYREAATYRVLPELPAFETERRLPRWKSRLRFARHLLAAQAALRKAVQRDRFRRVLMASYLEYLAPIWAPRLRDFSRSGVVFGAIVHDPVRDYVVGPQWWHRWSVKSGYSFLREAFVHKDIDLRMEQYFPSLRTTVIPHGPFEFPDPATSRREVRNQLALPDDCTVILTFGHIRDGKNLDLLLRAIVPHKNIYLIVAGKDGAPGQKRACFYQELARKLSVADRCRWLIEFIEPVHAANLFNCADIVALTYSAKFNSASGVLNVAARYRKPVLASCGDSPLGSMVDQYRLGVRVRPDSAEAISGGIAALTNSKVQWDWDGYLRDNSWNENARRVIDAMNLYAA